MEVALGRAEPLTGFDWSRKIPGQDHSGLYGMNRLRRDLNIPAVFLCERPGQHTYLCSSGQIYLISKPVCANVLSGCIRQAIASSPR